MNVRIPVRRIMDRLDSYLEQKDFDSAEALLKNWAAEAEAGGDLQGRLTVLGEQIGLYRRLDRRKECMEAIESSLDTIRRMGDAKTVQIATAYLNAATGYKAFDEEEKALALYRRAQGIYEAQLAPDDERLAGLYNNMAVTLTGLGEYSEAGRLLEKALGILGGHKGREADMAVTFLNMADLAYADQGPEEGEAAVESCLAKAEELLDSGELERDGYYAFVCEKCAPVFGYYGHFVTKQKLMERAGEVYERS